MKIGIMQPYFLPYIGYWQLMNAVDKYVVFDDVNFIKRGWINRNRILSNGNVIYFNLPMVGATVSQNNLINEVHVSQDKSLIVKNLRRLEGAYQKAPFFSLGYELVEEILNYESKNIADFNYNSFMVIGKYLGVKTEFILSSNLQKDINLKAQDKILDICKILGASEYYNAYGGTELYSFEKFKSCGISLKFLKTREIFYAQFGKDFHPNLSIIDMIMFVPRQQIQDYLTNFDLIERA